MKKLLLSVAIAGFVLGIGFYMVWMKSWSLYTPNEVQSEDGTFFLRAALDVPRTEAGGVAVGGSLYILGGINSFAQTLTDFHAYDPNTDKWTRLPDVPYPVNHPGVVTDGERIYVAGGFGPLGIRMRGFMFAKWDPYNYLYVFEIESGTWKKLHDMPDARGAGGVTFG
jgi:hypothetical protein